MGDLRDGQKGQMGTGRDRAWAEQEEEGEEKEGGERGLERVGEAHMGRLNSR